MCSLVEEYAKEREIETAIEISLEYGVTEEVIIEKLIKRYNITEEQAHEYFDMYTEELEDE